MPRLAFISSNVAGQYCDLVDGKYSVGRSRKNRIVIRDKSISVEHCEILVSGTEVIVRERGSRNGVFVDGVRVRAQKGVRHGETIRFGRIEARLDLSRQTTDASTAISAMDELRRYETEKNANSDGDLDSQLSFLIEPRSAASAIASNPTVEIATPVAIQETSHSLPSNDQEHCSPVKSSRDLNRWIYAGLGFVLIIAIAWILSKL